jgi:3-hydroxyisobutyrate dehydrogenase-like beta-hydroxyacid dehydrogenase
MTVKTVGILSPGDMGHAVGQVLVSHGLRVITCLEGRSERTKLLAAHARIIDVASYQDLVSEADVLLSILVPAQAVQAAQKIGRAMAENHTDLLYVDCNAIAPQTARRIGEMIAGSGGRFVDVGIVGSPPGKGGSTFFYASGPYAKDFESLSHFGLNTIMLGNQMGQASAMKMCYAASTKGLVALFTELLVAAEFLGVSLPLRERLQSSKQSLLYEQMAQELPKMPEKSKRWIGEMEEISKTFEHVGLTPNIFTGAADMYRFTSLTELAERIPEDTTPHPTLSQMVEILAGALPTSAPEKKR